MINCGGRRQCDAAMWLQAYQKYYTPFSARQTPKILAENFLQHQLGAAEMEGCLTHLCLASQKLGQSIKYC